MSGLAARCCVSGALLSPASAGVAPRCLPPAVLRRVAPAAR
jgi:hypothetical protein